MTTVLLIRHCVTDVVNTIIAGRAPGVRLNAKGEAQASELAAGLARVSIASVYSSPLERAIMTATPLAEQRGLEVIARPGLNEIDFGDWTGARFEDLGRLPLWQRFNVNRTAVRIPGGETMLEAQARAVSAFESIRLENAGNATVAVVTHGDIARSILCGYLGISLDLMLRIEISPGSVTTLVLDDLAARVIGMNSLGPFISANREM